MARILIDIKEATKEKIMLMVRKNKTTIKKFILNAIGLKNEN